MISKNNVIVGKLTDSNINVLLTIIVSSFAAALKRQTGGKKFRTRYRVCMIKPIQSLNAKVVHC